MYNLKMKISYLEDNGLKLTPKEKFQNTPRKNEPPKLDRSINYDSSSDEKSPTSLMGSQESFLSMSGNSSTWASYFSRCFTVINVLGEGSFGKVYEVCSHIDHKTYAIKVDKSRVRNKAHRNLKLEEVKRHEELSHHPNIVRLYNAWEEKRIIYMQLELCETSLQLMSQKIKHMPEKETWNVLVDMLWALQHLHGLNFIHLDIKLDNILVGFDGRYKLSDFGLVYNVSNSNRKDPLEGDAKYLAPELLDNYFTKAADIFSLGISILELAANVTLPNHGPVWHGLRQNQLPYTQTAHLSEELVSIIAWMMTCNFLMRPSADELLRHSILLPKIKARKQVFCYQDMRSKLITTFHIVIINPMKRMASACSLAVRYIFTLWNRSIFQVPSVQITVDTPSVLAPNNRYENGEPFITSSRYTDIQHEVTPRTSSNTKKIIRELRVIRQSPNDSVRRNLFNSFSDCEDQF